MATTPTHLFTQSVTWTPYTVTANATTGLPTFAAGSTQTIFVAIQPGSASEGLLNARQSGRTRARMFAAPTLTIAIQDKITWKSRDWRVVGGTQDQSGLGVVAAWDLEAEE